MLFRLQVGGTDTKFVLKTLGEIRGRRKADIVGYFGNILACGEQQLVAFIEAGRAEQLDGRGTRDGLHLTIELHTTEVHRSCQIVNTEVAIP